MSENSAIEWTHHSWNPWWGCTKVSHGCTNCYAETLATRYGWDVWGPKAGRRFFGDAHWKEPLKWNRDAIKAGERKRVFCASMADVFERHMLPDVNAGMDQARARLWQLIDATPMLDWLLLTKRPENIREMVPHDWLDKPRANVWLGTSTESQEQANSRIPALLAVPAVVHFLSMEPLLGPINLHPWLCMYGNPAHPAHRYNGWCSPADEIDWIIVGGESGPGARPMHPEWARNLRDQATKAGVPFFMKQMGGVRDKRHNFEDLPDDLRVREYPEAVCTIL